MLDVAAVLAIEPRRQRVLGPGLRRGDGRWVGENVLRGDDGAGWEERQ